MKWFKEIFLPSFEECNNKKITEKQAIIFKKYLNFESVKRYSSIINGKIIILECFPHLKWIEYYLTIKKDNSETIKSLRNTIKYLEEDWDIAFKENDENKMGNIEKEINKIEKMIQRLY